MYAKARLAPSNTFVPFGFPRAFCVLCRPSFKTPITLSSVSYYHHHYFLSPSHPPFSHTHTPQHTKDPSIHPTPSKTNQYKSWKSSTFPSAPQEKSQGCVGCHARDITPISFVMTWPRRILTGTISGFCIRSLLVPGGGVVVGLLGRRVGVSVHTQREKETANQNTKKENQRTRRRYSGRRGRCRRPRRRP